MNNSKETEQIQENIIINLIKEIGDYETLLLIYLIDDYKTKIQSNVDKSSIDYTNVDKSSIDYTNVDKSSIDYTNVDKSYIVFFSPHEKKLIKKMNISTYNYYFIIDKLIIADLLDKKFNKKTRKMEYLIKFENLFKFNKPIEVAKCQ